MNFDNGVFDAADCGGMFTLLQNRNVSSFAPFDCYETPQIKSQRHAVVNKNIIATGSASARKGDPVQDVFARSVFPCEVEVAEAAALDLVAAALALALDKLALKLAAALGNAPPS